MVVTGDVASLPHVIAINAHTVRRCGMVGLLGMLAILPGWVDMARAAASPVQAGGPKSGALTPDARRLTELQAPLLTAFHESLPSPQARVVGADSAWAGFSARRGARRSLALGLTAAVLLALLDIDAELDAAARHCCKRAVDRSEIASHQSVCGSAMMALKNAALQVVTVLCDEGNTNERLRAAEKYKSRHRLPFDVHVEAKSGEVQTAFHVEGYPSLVLIDGTGRKLWEGHPKESDRLERILRDRTADR